MKTKLVKKEKKKKKKKKKGGRLEKSVEFMLIKNRCSHSRLWSVQTSF